MAAYSSVAKRTKNALKTILQALTYDAGEGAEAAFVSVLGTTAGELDASPIIRVLPGDYVTTKTSVAQNDRVLRFILRGHLKLEANESSEAQFDYMYDLTELLLDALDEGDDTRILTTIDPTLVTYMLNATQGDWITRPFPDGIDLFWDIHVEVKYSKDL